MPSVHRDVYTGNLSWDIQPDEPMMIKILDRVSGEVFMSIFLGEAMELAGKDLVTQHAAECNRSEWIKDWHDNILYKKHKVWKALTAQTPPT